MRPEWILFGGVVTGLLLIIVILLGKIRELNLLIANLHKATDEFTDNDCWEAKGR